MRAALTLAHDATMMNGSQRSSGAGFAVLLIGTLALFPALETDAAERPAVDSAHRWRDPCPAADTVPICATDLRLDTASSGSDGTKVVVRAAPTKRDTAIDWVDSIGTGCRRVPWQEIVACPD
jgi:hypothetical protein